MHPMARKRMARLVWPRFSSSMEALNWNAQMFATLAAYGKGPVEKCSTRKQMYGAINARLGNATITYLEFGVWKGESLTYWTEINNNPGSRFYGFDSFEGLPEVWDHGFGHATTTEHFNLNGDAPKIADQRITLIKGWFQHTLRGFLCNTQLLHPLVVHIDCDLHSSALYTLSTLDPLLTSGDIVIFDEYTSPVNEHLAWEEYKRAFMRAADCVAMGNRWCQTAFQMKDASGGAVG